MDIRITPHRLSGSIIAPGSKSHAHRLIIASALSDKSTKIKLNCLSDDVMATLDAIGVFGAGYEINGEHVTVIPGAFDGLDRINCRESGTTARLIIPIAAVLSSGFTAVGEGSLLQRPFRELFDCLRKNGCEISNDTLPASFGKGLHGGEYRIRGDISSQYVSGLLFALPLLKKDSEIILTTPLESKGYVDMTLEVLRLFGIKIRLTEKGYFIKGGQKYVSPETDCIEAEGDWSNAAYWLTAGVDVKGLNTESCQKDKNITYILENIEQISELDVSDMPDLVPAIAVIFALNKGTRRIVNASRLRLKESDRLKSTAAMIYALGGRATETENGLEITGGKLAGGSVSSCGDHRIAMAAAIAASFAEHETVIENAQAVNKSYPEFFEDYKRLGGIADVI